MDSLYKGFYARFETVSKAEGIVLMGPDHLVGDDYEVFFKTEEGEVVAWVRNRFGAETGFFDAETSRKLQLAKGREQTIRAILVFVAYSDEPDPGVYWGQMALFCFNPTYSEKMNAFVDRVAAMISEGTRPAIDLGAQAVAKVLEEPGWVPNDTVSLPKKEEGTAVLKDRRSMKEKMIEQGRAGNKGCYLASILSMAAVVVAIVFFVFNVLRG